MSAYATSTLFELLPIGAYRSTLEGDIYQANRALLRINGYESEAQYKTDGKVMGAQSYVNPNRRIEFRRAMEKNGEVSDFVSETYRLRTGERIWVREHAHVVRDANGQPQFYEGTIEDITQEHVALDRLQDSASLLRNVLHTIPDRVWLKDMQGRYLTCNEAFATGVGASAVSIIGTCDADWVGETMAAQFQATDLIAIREGRAFVTEEDMSNPNFPNQGIYEIIKTPLINPHGETIGVLGIARSIQQRKDSERLLRDISEQLELALMGADLGRWDHDLTLDKGFYIDERACKLLGRDTAESTIGRPWGHLVHPEDMPAALQALRAHVEGNVTLYDAEFRARHGNGGWLWVSSRGKVVQFSKQGTPERMVGTLMDISARKDAEVKLRSTQAELRATLNALPDLLFELTLGGCYVSAHSTERNGLRTPSESLIGRTVIEVLPPDAAAVCLAALQQAHTTGRSMGLQYSLDLPDGKCWYELSVVRKGLDTDDEEHFIAIARDITEGKAAAEAIKQLAFHDSLTGLPNRRLVMDRLERAISHSTRNGQHGALMFLDLDGFKKLNDTQGHDVGDLLLVEVAKRLNQSVRAIDTVGRLGGDEFVVLLQDLSPHAALARDHAGALGQKILDALNKPYTLAARQHTSTPSIGVSMFFGEAATHHEVLKRADVAMYQAKAQGRNTLCFFEPK